MVLNGVAKTVAGVLAYVRTDIAGPVGFGMTYAVKHVSPVTNSKYTSYLGCMSAVCIIPMDVPR